MITYDYKMALANAECLMRELQRVVEKGEPREANRAQILAIAYEVIYCLLSYSLSSDDDENESLEEMRAYIWTLGNTLKKVARSGGTQFKLRYLDEAVMLTHHGFRVYPENLVEKEA